MLAKRNKSRKDKIQDLPKRKGPRSIFLKIVIMMFLFVIPMLIMQPELSFNSVADETSSTSQKTGSTKNKEDTAYTKDNSTASGTGESSSQADALKNTSPGSSGTASNGNNTDDNSSDQSSTSATTEASKKFQNTNETEYNSADDNQIEAYSSDTDDDTTDLAKYLKTRDGECSQVLYDENMLEMVMDEDGNYSGIFGDNYTYQFILSAPKGIAPGTYTYQMPKGLTISEEDRTEQEFFSDDDTLIGTRSISTDNLLTLVIDEGMNDKSDLTGYIEIIVSIEPQSKVETPSEAEIEKDGYFSPEDGKFHFTITATIPAYDGVEYKAWCLYDIFSVGLGEEVDETFDNAEISLNYGNTSYRLKNLKDSDDKDSYAYVIKENSDISHCLYLVNRCKCNFNNCSYLINGQTCNLDIIDETDYADWCLCWNLVQNATLKIDYTLDSSYELLNNSATKSLVNTAYLSELLSDSSISSSVTLTVPTLLEKLGSSSTDRTNPEIAYTLLINPDKLDLSGRDELTVEDILTSGTYNPATLQVTAEDKDNNVTTLSSGTDYVLDYTKSSDDSPQRKLSIKIINPGACCYTVTYQAIALGSKEGTAELVTVKNTATLKLYNNPSVSSTIRHRFYSKWSYKSVKLTLTKVAASDINTYLEGAVYGLYTADGTEIDEKTTGADGTALFQTDIAHDVVLRRDTPYYLKEITAPDGYELDETPHWFYVYFQEDATLESDYPDIQYVEAEGSDATVTLVGGITCSDVAVPMLPETGGTDPSGRICLAAIAGAMMYSALKLLQCL